MSDELRDRIAEAIFNVRDDEFDLDGWGDLDSTEKERYRCDAQAVIDDLGLIVERTLRVMDYGAGEFLIPETRVVGKWER